MCLIRVGTKLSGLRPFLERNWTALLYDKGVQANSNYFFKSKGVQSCSWRTTFLQSLVLALIKHTWTSPVVDHIKAELYRMVFLQEQVGTSLLWEKELELKISHLWFLFPMMILSGALEIRPLSSIIFIWAHSHLGAEREQIPLMLI